MNVNMCRDCEDLDGGYARGKVIDAVGDVVERLSKASSVPRRSGSGTDQWIAAQTGQLLVGVVAHGHDEVSLVRHLDQRCAGEGLRGPGRDGGRRR